MRYAIIDENGLIVNCIEWDGESGWLHPEGCAAIQSDEGSIGDSIIEGVLIQPDLPKPVPPTILEQIHVLEAQQTPRRIREATLGIDNDWLMNLNTQINALRAELS